MSSRPKEVLQRRELILALASKEIKTRYRRAAGGFGWMLILPLSQAFVFIIVFSRLFRIGIENYALYLLCGLFSWGFLRSSLDSASVSILNNANLVKKIYFPRQVLPFSSVVSNLANFMICLCLLSIVSVYYSVDILAVLAWVPLLVFLELILVSGLALLFAGLTSIFLQVQFLTEILFLALFYLSPIVYSLDMVKKSVPASLYKAYPYLNPFVGILDGFQKVFYYGSSPDLALLTASGLVSLLIFILGWFVFSKCEEVFVDII